MYAVKTKRPHTNLTSSSGSSSISTDQTTLAVTNLFDGIDFFPVQRGPTPSADIKPSGSAKVEIVDNVMTSITCDRHGLFFFGGSSGTVHIATSSPPAVVQTLQIESESSPTFDHLDPIDVRY